MTFDLDKANQMLDELGYKMGARRHPDRPTATRWRTSVITPTDVAGVDRDVPDLQADFQKIGVQLTQKALD